MSNLKFICVFLALAPFYKESSVIRITAKVQYIRKMASELQVKCMLCVS